MCRVSAIPELVGIVVDLAVVGTPAGNSRDQPFKDRKFMVQIVNFKLKRGGGECGNCELLEGGGSARNLNLETVGPRWSFCRFLSGAELSGNLPEGGRNPRTRLWR